MPAISAAAPFSGNTKDLEAQAKCANLNKTSSAGRTPLKRTLFAVCNFGLACCLIQAARSQNPIEHQVTARHLQANNATTIPAGGWFDYMNMRTNGFDFHMQLARGEVAWTDERVKETFANWRKIIDMGGYIDDHQSYSWQEALKFMTDGDAASYLIGNFAVPHLREAGLDDTQIDFYQFPTIADVPQGEDAPTDTFHIPANASNKDNARAFLQFVTSADVQTKLNAGDSLGQLPVNAASSVDADEFLEQGFEMLSTNAQGGVAQFFDRDFPAEMASMGMEGLQEFMVFPDNLDDILARLEEARGRIYK